MLSTQIDLVGGAASAPTRHATFFPVTILGTLAGLIVLVAGLIGLPAALPPAEVLPVQVASPAPVLAPPPVQVATPAPVNPETSRLTAVTKKLVALYAIEQAMAHRIATAAVAATRNTRIHPELLLAIMATESRFNPEARSHQGAVGLMQVVPKWHRQRIARLGKGEGIHVLEVNIAVGADILKEAYARAGGDLRETLLRYNGTPYPNSGYPDRVLAQLSRIAPKKAKS